MPEYTSRFIEQAIPYIFELEGVTATNHPRDPGGLTKYGISKRDNPDLYSGGRMPTKQQRARAASPA